LYYETHFLLRIDREIAILELRRNLTDPARHVQRTVGATRAQPALGEMATGCDGMNGVSPRAVASMEYRVPVSGERAKLDRHDRLLFLQSVKRATCDAPTVDSSRAVTVVKHGMPHAGSAAATSVSFVIPTNSE
jgi:hypothetical protein